MARAVKPPKIKVAIRIGVLLSKGFPFLDRKDCDDFWPRSSRRRRMFNIRKISQKRDRVGETMPMRFSRRAVRARLHPSRRPQGRAPPATTPRPLRGDEASDLIVVRNASRRQVYVACVDLATMRVSNHEATG